MILKDDLILDLKNIGVLRGDTLNVKASLRSIGEVKGGVNTLIEALLEVVGEEGTIVTDSFISIASPFSFKFWSTVVDSKTHSYAGVLANALLKYPGVVRSSHPIQKFALLGSRATELAGAHTEGAYAYGVLEEMAKIGGKNLKIGADEKVPGVGTTHVAIGIGKIRQKRPFAGVRFRDKDGYIRKFYLNWAGGCMAALYNLNKLYDQTPGAIIGQKKIGNSIAKLSSMQITLDAELKLLNDDPISFLRCGNPNCLPCKFSWENYEDDFFDFLKKSFLKCNFKSLLHALHIKYLCKYKP